MLKCQKCDKQATFHITDLIDGKPKIMNSRYSDVWVKGAKGWQMVAWQSTPIP